MKILHIIDSLSGGGAEKLVNDLMPLFKEKHDCEVLILTDINDKYSEQLRRKNITVSIVPHKGHLNRLMYISKYILNNNYDIVHAHLFPVIYYCSFLKKIHRKKFPILLMTEHNTDNRRRHYKWMKPVEKWIYKSFNHVISISNETQEQLINWINPINQSRFSVINNGVPLSDFFYAEPYNRNELIENVSDEDILLGMVGSFTEQKGHTFILDVLKKLPSNYKLLLIGEGPLFEIIKAKIYELNIQDRVFFLGFRKDVARIFKTIDICVIPSRWEGFGLIAVEAMATGKPIVASDVPGLASVIGEEGSKVKYGEIEKFKEEILKIDLNKSTDYIIEHSRKYDITIMAEKYLKTYDELMKG